MPVRELIEKLKELPEDCNIIFCDYDKTYEFTSEIDKIKQT